MLTWRAAWRDWGFAENLYRQASRFTNLAGSAGEEDEKLAYVRASIVFSLISFEAHFNEVVRRYLQANREKIVPDNLGRVEKGLASRTPIDRALREWPALLTGSSLNTETEPYLSYSSFREYRNSLVHGKITQPIQSLGVLVQDMETVDNARRSVRAVAEMIVLVSRHFSFDPPSWAQ